MPNLENKINLLNFHTDFDWQHIIIADQNGCRLCRHKPCLAVCPSGVFQWNYIEGSPITVLYQQCIECGACRLFCPSDNIDLSYPRGGFGVMYEKG